MSQDNSETSVCKVIYRPTFVAVTNFHRNAGYELSYFPNDTLERVAYYDFDGPGWEQALFEQRDYVWDAERPTPPGCCASWQCSRGVPRDPRPVSFGISLILRHACRHRFMSSDRSDGLAFMAALLAPDEAPYLLREVGEIEHY